MLEDRPEYMTALPDGLAAAQKREPFGPLVVVNPRLRPLSPAGARFTEGCLSVPGYQVWGSGWGGWGGWGQNALRVRCVQATSPSTSRRVLSHGCALPLPPASPTRRWWSATPRWRWRG